jgi:hypothetical protein
MPPVLYTTASYTAVENHTVPRTITSSKYILLNLTIKAREESAHSPLPPYLIYRRTIAVFVEVPTDPNVKDFRDVDELKLKCRGIWDKVAQIVRPLGFKPVGGAWAATSEAKRARDFMTVSVPYAGDLRSNLVLRRRPDPLACVTLRQYGDIDHVLSCTRRYIHQICDWTDVIGIMDVTVSFLDACDPADPDNTFLAIDRNQTSQSYPFDSATNLGRILRDADPFPQPVSVLFVPAHSGGRMFSCKRLYEL